MAVEHRVGVNSQSYDSFLAAINLPYTVRLLFAFMEYIMDKTLICSACGLYEYLDSRSLGIRVCICGMATFEAVSRTEVLLFSYREISLATLMI